MGKEDISKDMDIFNEDRSRALGHINKFDLTSFWKSSCSLGRLFYTTPTISRERDLGLTSF
jgi:hypothetical protein